VNAGEMLHGNKTDGRADRRVGGALPCKRVVADGFQATGRPADQHLAPVVRHRSDGSDRQRFVRVHVETASDRDRGFALVLGNGRRIEACWCFEEAELARLIRVAEESLQKSLQSDAAPLQDITSSQVAEKNWLLR
jgi:hypothetical protein